MKRYRIYWKVDWSEDTMERECFAPDKEWVIRLYDLTAEDVKWYQIDEI